MKLKYFKGTKDRKVTGSSPVFLICGQKIFCFSLEGNKNINILTTNCVFNFLQNEPTPLICIALINQMNEEHGECWVGLFMAL